MGNRPTNPYDQTARFIPPPVAEVPSVAGQVVGEMTTMLVSQGLKKQADKLRREERMEDRALDRADKLEDREYREGALLAAEGRDDARQDARWDREDARQDARYDREDERLDTKMAREDELHKKRRGEKRIDINEQRSYNEAQAEKKLERIRPKLSVSAQAEVDTLKDEMESILEIEGADSKEYTAAKNNYLSRIDSFDKMMNMSDEQKAEIKKLQAERSNVTQPPSVTKPSALRSSQSIVDEEPMVNRAGDAVTTVEQAKEAIMEHEMFTKRNIDKANHEREIMKLRNKFNL